MFQRMLKPNSAVKSQNPVNLLIIFSEIPLKIVCASPLNNEERDRYLQENNILSLLFFWSEICCSCESLSAELSQENVEWLTAKFSKKQQISEYIYFELSSSLRRSMRLFVRLLHYYKRMRMKKKG